MRNDPHGTSVAFGIFSRNRSLLGVANVSGLTPTLEQQRGEEFTTRGGTHIRPQHVWQVRSSRHVNSDDPADHIRWMLDRLEPSREALQDYIDDPDVLVVFRIDCICPDSIGGFSVDSGTTLRIASISNRLDVGFVGETGDEQNA